MKKKDLQELSAKTEKDLAETLEEKRKDLFKMRMDLKQNKLKNTRGIFMLRKDIARVMTILREKELAQEKV